MSSILKVSEIQDPTNGNTALEVDTSGNVTAPVRLLQPKAPHVFVDFGGGSSYISVTAGTIPFDNIVEHSGGGDSAYSTSTYKFTCPIDGIYAVTCGVISQNDTDKFEIDLRRNDVNVTRNYQLYRGFSFTNHIKCDANDTLHLHLGSTQTLYHGTTTNRYTYGIYTLIHAI